MFTKAAPRHRSNHLRPVPPTPDAARRPSRLALVGEIIVTLWLRFNRWIDSHFYYEEIDGARMGHVLRGWCADCDDRVNVLPAFDGLSTREHCAVCDSAAVSELGWVWMERER